MRFGNLIEIFKYEKSQRTPVKDIKCVFRSDYNRYKKNVQANSHEDLQEDAFIWYFNGFKNLLEDV